MVLFALLLFTGAGAALSARAADPRRALTAALGVACGLMLVLAFALEPMLRALIDLPFAARVALTVAMLAPLGLTLGMAMPIGLRRLSALHPDGVPWAWGINGITSVLASALGVFIAIVAGFTVATLAAVACYLVAIAHVVARALAGRRRRAPTRAPAEPRAAGRRRRAVTRVAVVIPNWNGRDWLPGCLDSLARADASRRRGDRRRQRVDRRVARAAALATTPGCA